MNTASRRTLARARSADSPLRAGIYVRISQDRTGAGLGVERQEEDCRALCDRKGWQAARVYVDNDVSAYSGRPRPAWRELLADVAAGRIEAVVCWHVDRLTRSPRELEDVIDLHDSHGIALASATGEIDLSTPAGRMVARTLGTAARHEAEHKAERQRRERLQKAKAGQPHTTGTRGYGYTPAMTVIDAEAAVVREAATRVLAGESLRSVCRDFNDRTIPSAKGGHWQVPVLKALLTSARISGRREYYGQIMHEHSWPAIITPAASDELRALLTARKGTQPPARTYLLSGILTCAICHKGLSGRPHNGRPRYICAKHPGNGRCGKVAIMADLADAEVRDRVLTALDTPDFLAQIIAAATAGTTEASHISDELRAIEARREELARDYARRRIDRKEWLTARDELASEADRLTSELARTQHGRALADFAAMHGHLWDRWDTLTTGGKRALITAVVHHIDIRPATHRRFDPDRIADPTWRV